ncbi:MAG: DNA repair protein RadC [Actinomycetota bacterium]
MNQKYYKMKDIPNVDRPRERLIKLGPDVLKDSELLAVIIGSGTRGYNALRVAEKLLRKYRGQDLSRATVKELRSSPGVGEARACQLAAAFELSRRFLLRDDGEVVTIKTPDDVYKSTSELKKARKEYFLALYLNARNQLIKKEVISIGSLNANIVHPREVFEPAVGVAAASLILVHNHPSGQPDPSDDDISLTKRLVLAGEIMGIEILDHIVVGEKGFVSIKEKGLM